MLTCMSMSSQTSGETSSSSECRKVLKDWDQSDSPVKQLCADGAHHQHETDEASRDIVMTTKKNFKQAMQKKFALTSEGNGDEKSSLNSVYTSVYVTAQGPDEEHPPRHTERDLSKRPPGEGSVRLSDMLKPSADTRSRTALTKGVAGIGKSFAVHKFILDWAEERTHQELDFIFCLAFRELNVSGGETSLHLLLTEFHPALSDLKDPLSYVHSKMLVVLDGLDESRLQLDFDNSQVVRSVDAVAPLGNLLVNLIQGNLLPDASLWITSRPAASAQVPAKYVDTVTEIRGFSDAQKEEYFRRRFSHDSRVAERIISQVQSSPSLSIMCQIPVFCWISALLFEDVFTGADKDTTPQTLTEMMAHFLFAQTERRSRKYDADAEENKQTLLERHREFLLKLGKLAFVHLQEKKLIFYEDDLQECGLDVKEASVYSGFYNAVLREEDLFSHRKFFFFVHLTIQEFFAALYVYQGLMDQNTPELCRFLGLKDQQHGLSVLDLLKKTVAKVMEKQNGHLDFFLRFLLGLMVQQNRRVLQGLLTSPDPNQDTDKKILTYLKSIRRKTVSPDGCISLFQAMVEMRDGKVKDDIQEHFSRSGCSDIKLTPVQCSALAYMLQVSKDDLEVLDLKSYNTSDEGRRRLIPAVKISRKATLADCRVTSDWVEHLAFALRFPHSALRNLDLSNNDLKDCGVGLLCRGLSDQRCRLETLRLSGCQVTETGCGHLSSALRSNPSHMKELDLSYNDPGPAGEKILTELKSDPQNKLSLLNLEHGGSHRMKPGFHKYGCELTLEPSTTQKNLRVSEGNRKATWMGDGQSSPSVQALCEQGLRGRAYWEVKVSGPLGVGVRYRGAATTEMGHSDGSWGLLCSSEGHCVQHNKEKVWVSSCGWRSGWVGVYLDWAAGTLSFYRVCSDSQVHLHTFRAAFAEPVYAAVELRPQSSALYSPPV